MIEEAEVLKDDADPPPELGRSAWVISATLLPKT